MHALRSALDYQTAAQPSGRVSSDTPFSVPFLHPSSNQSSLSTCLRSSVVQSLTYTLNLTTPFPSREADGMATSPTSRAQLRPGQSHLVCGAPSHASRGVAHVSSALFFSLFLFSLTLSRRVWLLHPLAHAAGPDRTAGLPQQHMCVLVRSVQYLELGPGRAQHEAHELAREDAYLDRKTQGTRVPDQPRRHVDQRGAVDNPCGCPWRVQAP